MARNLKISKRKATVSLLFQMMLCLPHSKHLTSFLIHSLDSLNPCSLLIFKIQSYRGARVQDGQKLSAKCPPSPLAEKSLPSKPKPGVCQDSTVEDCHLNARAETHLGAQHHATPHLPLASDY